MKFTKIFSLLLAGLFGVYSHVSACVSPTNIEGVAFTDKEELHFESLSALGSAGVDYKVSLNENGGKTVCYPSHYNADAMVFIGNVSLLYKQDVTLNCLGIIIPLADDMLNNHTPVPLEMFDFTKAVKVELEWLMEHGILNINHDKIDSISKGLGGQDNGSVQYWTKQHATLHYNSWYTYNAENGEWEGGATDGVNGIVKSVNGCSVIQIPEIYKFDKVPVKDARNGSADMNDFFIDVQGRTLFVDGSENFTAVQISVVSASGRVMKVFNNAHIRKGRLALNDIARGIYIISCKYNGTTLNRSVFIQ